MTVLGFISRPTFLAAAAWLISVKTIHPLDLIAFSKRSTVSPTECLLALVINPVSADHAARSERNEKARTRTHIFRCAVIGGLRFGDVGFSVKILQAIP